LSQPLVRARDDHCLHHPRVFLEYCLDLFGGDVESAADDDVLDPTGYVEVAVVVQIAPVTRVQPAVGAQRGRLVGIEIADGGRAGSNPDFTVASARALNAVFVDDAD